MTDVQLKDHTSFVLPAAVVSRVDVSRLVSEVERLDGEMTAATVRSKVDDAKEYIPTLTDQLGQFLQQNKLSLQESKERSRIVKELRKLKDTVPVIHMTFAVTADPESLAQIAAWLRASIHPQAVISVGLQPNLVAGVYLRTPNHVHDLSLRKKLESSRGVMVEALETYRAK